MEHKVIFQKRVFKMRPVGNRKRITPVWFEIEKSTSYKRVGTGECYDINRYYNEGWVAVYLNKKNGNLYGTMYLDGCFYPYFFGLEEVIE